MYSSINRQTVNGIQNATKQRRTSIFSLIVLCIYFAISIFEPYLNGIVGSVTKYYIFIIMFVLLYQNHGTLLPTQAAKAMIVWVALKIVSLLWSLDYSTARLHFISQIGMVMFLLVLLSNEYNEDTFRWIEITYWASSGILGLLSLFFSRSYREVFSTRQVLVVAGVETDPNNQAALLIVGVCISLVNILYKRKWIVASFVLLLVNTYGCFLTGSRAGLLTIVVLAFFCAMLPDKQRKVGIVIGRIVLVIFFLLIAIYVARKLDPGIYNRLFNLEDYEGGSGRSVLWTNGWKAYSNDILSILFGIGWGTAITVGEPGAHVGLHNTFLIMLCDVGLVGVLVFLSPIVIMVVGLIKKRKQFPVMLLIAQFIPAFFLDAINKRFFWNAIFILGMYYYYYVNTNNKEIAHRSRYKYIKEA